MNRNRHDNIHLRRPMPRGHRRRFRLHDINRIHRVNRYERNRHVDRGNQPAQAHVQYYQFHWETENNRWVWMRKNIFNNTSARCIVCHITLRATITNIRSHEQSQNHRHNMLNINVPVDDVYDPHLNREDFDTQMATIKILLCSYFADESISYQKIDTLLPLIKRIARYPGALQEVHMTRTDMSKMISRVIAPVHKQELAEQISRSKFSTLFDESTGISKDKSGCLLIRFADHRSYKIRTTLWDLIPIYRADNEHSDATAESLYNLTINSLFGQQQAEDENRAHLQVNNYLSAGTDGCNTMIGVRNSMRQRLFDNFPGINFIVCPCHAAHLCAKHTVHVIFAVVVLLMQNCYNWFSSAKRLHALQQHQIRLNLNVHRILRLVDTRWLTGLPSLIRLRDQITAIDATLADELDNPQAIQLLQQLRSPIMHCYIEFLIFILEVIEDLNGWLQTEEVIFPEVFNRIRTDFKDILLCYMHEDHVENADLLNIDLENIDHFLNNEEMNIGPEARRLAQELPENEYLDLMRLTREFLIHLATEWLERLVLPWARFECVECLLTENALSEAYHELNRNIIYELIAQFPRALPEGINGEVLQAQWNELLNNQLEVLPETTTDYFWFVVYDMDDGNGRFLFRDLAEFALNILSTPHSNAQPERIWSVEKIIKNKYRNKLSIESVRSIILVKEMLLLHGCAKQVHLFVPSEEMVMRVRRRLFDIGQDIDEVNSDSEED